MRVSLLVTCLIDLFEPDTGADVVKVLRAAGCEVQCPEGQTCCGQPTWNAGFADEAAKVARATLDALDATGDDVIAVPAGSCATMIRVFWPELFEVVGDHAAADRARAVGARTKELTELLADCELPAMKLPEECRVAYHHSCHLLRELHGHDQPLDLLDDVEGCTRVDWKADERCCGFGGLFSMKLPEVSVTMADDKLASLADAQVDVVVSADSSCLMHLRGRARARGQARSRLATSHRCSRPRSKAKRHDGRHGHTLFGTTLRERTAEATTNVRLRGALARATARFGDHRTAALDTLEDADGLRGAARAIKADVISHLPELLEQFADNLTARGGQVFWASDGAEANQYIASVAERIGARTVVKSKSMATEETELNEALEALGCHVVETDLGEWIIQLAHHKPSHIIAPAVHLDRYQVAEILQAEVDDDRLLEAAPAPLAAFAREQLRAEFLARRSRHLGLQLRRRRDRVGRARDERRKWAALHVGATRAHRGDGNGAARRGLAAARPLHQPARPLRIGAAPVLVHEHHHGSAP